MASVTAGLWRIAIMPIDAAKTTLQVEGSSALRLLGVKIRSSPGTTNVRQITVEIRSMNSTIGQRSICWHHERLTELGSDTWSTPYPI